jgi:hypothetical protein
MFEKKTVLLVEWTRMPQPAKDEVADWHLFGNDRLLKLETSYRLGAGPQTPEHMLKEESIRWLYDGVVADGAFEGSFEDFLTRYHMQTFYWLAKSGQNFVGIDEVLIDICW